MEIITVVAVVVAAMEAAMAAAEVAVAEATALAHRWQATHPTTSLIRCTALSAATFQAEANSSVSYQKALVATKEVENLATKVVLVVVPKSHRTITIDPHSLKPSLQVTTDTAAATAIKNINRTQRQAMPRQAVLLVKAGTVVLLNKPDTVSKGMVSSKDTGSSRAMVNSTLLPAVMVSRADTTSNKVVAMEEATVADTESGRLFLESFWLFLFQKHPLRNEVSNILLHTCSRLTVTPVVCVSFEARDPYRVCVFRSAGLRHLLPPHFSLPSQSEIAVAPRFDVERKHHHLGWTIRHSAPEKRPQDRTSIKWLAAECDTNALGFRLQT